MTGYNRERDTTVTFILSQQDAGPARVSDQAKNHCSDGCSEAGVPAKVNGYCDGKGYRGGGKKGRRCRRGGKVSYFQYHLRVRQQRGQPQECEYCGVTDPLRRYEWANVTGASEDPLDYIRLCKSCHNRRDIREKREQHLRELYRQASDKRFAAPEASA